MGNNGKRKYDDSDACDCVASIIWLCVIVFWVAVLLQKFGVSMLSTNGAMLEQLALLVQEESVPVGEAVPAFFWEMFINASE